jgi:16S rRNA (uracil1498-N3)-methyltransferase
MSDLTKTPRIYTANPLGEGFSLSLEGGVHHYLRNVMRIAPGQALRIFNGRDGEFVARLEKSGKKNIELTIENKIREQQNPPYRRHLLFAPLKKERLDFLIEKSVELGATDFHPVLTHNTEVRKINEERLQAQIIEAAEQCERLDIPTLHGMDSLTSKLGSWPENLTLWAAIERMGIEPLPRYPDQDGAILVGPPGGFTADEKSDIVSRPFAHPVSLGKNILRTETAAIAGLALLNL